MSRAILLLPLGCLAAALVAQEAPPPAKVIGPQSVVEKYDAPVLKPDKLEGLIDFPALIAAPGANDGAEITRSVTRLDIEIVGTTGHDGAAEEFVHIVGASRAGEKAAKLYAALRTKLAKYRELPLTLGDVRFIRQDIAEVYRNEGFPLMAVVVPPQEVTEGHLKLQVNEFRLAGYSLQFGDGKGGYSASNPHWTRAERAEAVIEPLMSDQIVSREALDAKVKELNRNPYRSARVVFEPGGEQGQTKAIFQIDEKRLWNVQAGYNNHATKSSGTNRYSLGGSFGNFPFESQQLSWNATLGDHIEEFQNYSVIYTVPTILGHTLTANINYSDTASSSIPGINSASTTLQSTLSYDLPLLERGDFSWSLNASAVLKQFERASIFGGINVGGAQFDSAQLSVNSQFNWKESTATNQIVLTAVQSLTGVTSRNTDEAFRRFYNRADGGATTTHFVLNYARVQQLKPLSVALDGWSAETQLSWQFTGDVLGGGDDFTIGGPSVLRAYASSEISGDEGAYVVQLLHAKPIPGSKLGFLGGLVRQIALSGFLEAGEGRFKVGEHDAIWDYGVQASVAFLGGLNCNTSLGLAGKDAGRTEKGDAHCYVSANWRY